MNFELTQNQLDAQKIARDFAKNTLSKDILTRDASAEFPRELYDEMGRMGLIGIPYSVEMGGQGGDYLSYIVSLEEISKVDASMGITYSVCTSLFCGVIMNSDLPAEKKAEFIRPVASGKALGSFALTEPNAGSDAAGCKTIAVKDGDEWVINGSKCFITNGPVSDYFVVFTTTDVAPGTKGMACFMVPKGTPGFEQGKRHNTMGIRSAAVCELYFNNCRVPEANMVAEPGKGFALAMKSLDGGRIGVAAQGLGIAEGAFEIARKYMVEREQFGKPIAKQQSLAFRMVDMQVQIEQAKYMLYKAALDKQEGRPYTESAAKAKLVCTDAAMHVTTEAVQMLGGNGFMKEYHVERMMRDAKITQIYEGSNEIQKLILSGKLFK
ncbi:MAG TPA: acyl-CoA dehydrogenase family protein [Candidatus Flavonifractor merdavium]|nr:acyl-CoA dehydrogenase family protein [Candidatus Flavonifractor merdavium]